MWSNKLVILQYTSSISHQVYMHCLMYTQMQSSFALKLQLFAGCRSTCVYTIKGSHVYANACVCRCSCMQMLIHVNVHACKCSCMQILMSANACAHFWRRLQMCTPLESCCGTCAQSKCSCIQTIVCTSGAGCRCVRLRNPVVGDVHRAKALGRAEGARDHY